MREVFPRWRRRVVILSERPLEDKLYLATQRENILVASGARRLNMGLHVPR